MLAFLLNFAGNLADEYSVIRQRLLWIMNALLILSVLGVVANYVGTNWGIDWLRQANLIVGCVLAIISAYAIACPAVVVAVIGIGYARNDDAAAGTAETAKNLGMGFAWYVLGASFLFLILGTFPIARNPLAVFAIYLAILVLVLGGPTLSIRVVFSKYIIYLYSMVVIVLAVGSMVHGAAYKKAVGFDPYAYFRLSPIDMKADDIAKIEAANEEEVVMARLRIIERKVKRGESLTQEEVDLLAQINRNNVPGKAVDTAVAGWGLTTSATTAVYDAAASGIKNVSAVVSGEQQAQQPFTRTQEKLGKELEKFDSDKAWETVNYGIVKFDKAGIFSTTESGEMIMAKSGDRVVYAPSVKCKAGGYEISGGKVTDCHVPKGSDGSELSGAINIEGLGQAGQVVVLVQSPRS